MLYDCLHNMRGHKGLQEHTRLSTRMPMPSPCLCVIPCGYLSLSIYIYIYIWREREREILYMPIIMPVPISVARIWYTHAIACANIVSNEAAC